MSIIQRGMQVKTLCPRGPKTCAKVDKVAQMRSRANHLFHVLGASILRDRNFEQELPGSNSGFPRCPSASHADFLSVRPPCSGPLPPEIRRAGRGQEGTGRIMDYVSHRASLYSCYFLARRVFCGRSLSLSDSFSLGHSRTVQVARSRFPYRQLVSHASSPFPALAPLQFRCPNGRR